MLEASSQLACLHLRMSGTFHPPTPRENDEEGGGIEGDEVGVEETGGGG